MEPKEIYRTLFRLHILIEAAKRPLDSAGILLELRNQGSAYCVGSITHVLRQFEAEGYLTSHSARNSRPHTVYSITAAGRQRAREAKKRITKLIEALGSGEGLA